MPKSLLALLTLLFPPVLQAQTTILPQEFNTPVTIRSLVQGGTTYLDGNSTISRSYP